MNVSAKIVRTFDDRRADFKSGRKVAPPMAERKTCDCCGARIVKGAKLSNGACIGEDCADLIWRLEMAQDFANFAKSHSMKPAVSRFMASLAA